MKLRLFDFKIQKIIKTYAEKYKMDPELAAELIYDFEFQLSEAIKTKNNMRVPSIGLFHISQKKTEKYGKENLLFNTHPELFTFEGGEPEYIWTPSSGQ